MAWTERYVSVAGGGAHDGTTEADAWTLAEAIAAPYAAGQRINVKAGTYANTTTTRTFGVAGTTTAPIWWRGYNSTIGDLDADFVTAKPALTFTTGYIDVTGSYHIFSNLDISGAHVTGSRGQVTFRSGTNNHLVRCRVDSTAANANSITVNITGNYCSLQSSWIRANAAADVVALGTSEGTQIVGSALVAGKDGITTSTGRQLFAFCVFDNQAANGILRAGANLFFVLSCSFYSPASDGIEMSTLPSGGVIANNIFSDCGGYGINNSTGANTANIVRLNNAFYNNTSGTENGFGDTPSLAEVTETASPFTNAGASDFSLLSTALSKAAGLPGLFENQSYTSYLDIGAVQRVEPAAGGGGTSRLIDKGLIIS